MLGRVKLSAGKSTDITVFFLESEIARGTQLQAVLHEDNIAPDEFDFPGADLPINVGGQPVTKSFVFGIPILDINNQNSNGNLISVKEVLADRPSWIVIYKANQQEILGIQSVPVGISTEVDILLQNYPAGEDTELVAALYTNYGQPDRFEFPSPDTIVTYDGKSITKQFKVAYEQAIPRISASSTLPILGNALVISQVVALEDGWLIAYRDDAGNMGDAYGYTKIKAGENANVQLEIQPPFSIGETIWLVLHADNGILNELELPEPDLPVTSENQIVMLKATLTEPEPQFLGESGASPFNQSLPLMLSAFVSSGLLISLSMIHRLLKRKS